MVHKISKNPTIRPLIAGGLAISDLKDAVSVPYFGYVKRHNQATSSNAEAADETTGVDSFEMAKSKSLDKRTNLEYSGTDHERTSSSDLFSEGENKESAKETSALEA